MSMRAKDINDVARWSENEEHHSSNDNIVNNSRMLIEGVFC